MLVATELADLFLLIPRARPVELMLVATFQGVTIVKYHGTSPWHLKNSDCLRVAATVKYHGTSPWHLETRSEQSHGRELTFARAK